MPKLKRKHFVKHVPPKILWQMRIFACIFALMLGVVLYDIWIGVIGLLLVLFALGIGTVIGLISSRMSHLTWDKDSAKVVSRFDTLGIFILVGYILISVFRNKVVGLFIHGPAVGAFSFSLIAATMLGRVIGMRNSIHGILHDEGIIK
jgi:hypothetical protein